MISRLKHALSMKMKRPFLHRVALAMLLSLSPWLLADCRAQESDASKHPEAWPKSWRDYHQRFASFRVNRSKHLRQVKLRFDAEGMTFTWINLPDQWQEKLRLEIFSSGKINLKKSEKNTTSQSIDFLFNGKQFYSVPQPGIYFVSLAHWLDGAAYQTVSNTVVIEVERNAAGDAFVAKQLKPESLGAPHVGDAGWRLWADFHSYVTNRPLPEKAPPFEPAATIRETIGPVVIAKTDALDEKSLPDLEWHQYFDGRLLRVVPYTDHKELSFPSGPGMYLSMLVAHNEGIRVPISAPLKSFFADEGDGEMRRIALDKDRDGIADYWEKLMGLDPTDPNDASDIDKAVYKDAMRDGDAR